MGARWTPKERQHNRELKQGGKKRTVDFYQVTVNLGYGFRMVDDIVNVFGMQDLILLLDTFLAMQLLPIPQYYNAPFPVFK